MNPPSFMPSKRPLGLLFWSLFLILPAFLLSCIGDKAEDSIVLSFQLDSAKLGKSDSLRFEIYNGNAPGPGDTTKPIQVITVKTPASLKVDVKLSDKVESDFSVVVVGIDSNGVSQRKLFEFDDFAPDKDTPPAVLVAVITAVDLDMKPGETKATALTIKPDDAEDKRVTYTSSDTSVIKVVGANKDSLRAVADGTAQITVTAHVGGAKVTFTITVSSKIRVKGISAAPLSGVVGDTLEPELTFDPADATDKTYKLRSLDTGVVAVSGDKLVGRRDGSGKVEVTTTDGGLKDTFDVAIANPVIRLKDLTSKPLSGLVGDTLVPQLTFDPVETADKSFALKSLNTDVAVIEGLKVVAKAEGKTKVEVTATDGGIKDTFDVTVSKVPIKVKDVEGKGLRGLPGDTVVPDVVFDPVDATDQEFALKSLDTAIARILADGKIEAVKLGTAPIEITTHDGGIKDTFDMVVARAAFKPDVLPITSLKCSPCHIPGQIFNFQDSLVLLRKGVAALDRLQRHPDAPGKMPLKGSANGDLSTRQLGVLLDWLKQNVVAVTAMGAKDLKLNFGDTAEAEVSFTPSGATNQTFTLVAGDTTLISITKDNRILPLKEGTSNVTAQSDENTSFKAQFKVTVGAPSFQKNVLPITAFKCAPCHVPGQTFDFQDSSFLLIAGAKALDRLQRDSLAAGKMPLRGAPNGDLTAQEKAILLAWLNAKVIPLKGITVADDSVLVGREKAPDITYDPANATNKSYVLASTDTAKVGINGTDFFGKAVGTATVEVRALDGNHVKIINVKVKPVPVDSIAAQDSAGAIGDTVVPRILFHPEDAAVQTYTLSLVPPVGVVSLTLGAQAIVGANLGTAKVAVTSTDGARKDTLTFVVGPVLPKSLAIRDTNGVIGQTIPLTVTWNPVNTTNKNLTLVIAPADTAKASVSGTSLLAKAVGTASVTATSVADPALKATFTFTVGPVAVTSLSVAASPKTYLGTQFTSPMIRALITWNPANATDKGFRMVSSAPVRISIPTDTTANTLRLGLTNVSVIAKSDTSKKANWAVTVVRRPFRPFGVDIGKYTNIYDIMNVKCSQCHGATAGTLNWLDSNNVVTSRAKILARIADTASIPMPQPGSLNGDLTPKQLADLQDWLGQQ